MDDFSRDRVFSNQVDDRLARFYNIGDEEMPEDQLCPLYTRIQDLGSRYTLCETIAAGGMKKITRVFDARADRYVAMAQLLGEVLERDAGADRKELYESFLREACLTARLEHPCIITIYNIGVDGEGRPFFTMELKDGDSLSTILHKLGGGDLEYSRKYPLEELLQIFIKVCDAISYAHSQGVLHLDLKPSNIQVAPFGEVKVCDWGLGCIVDPDAVQKDSQRMHSDLLNSTPPFGTSFGTPGYMAPEQMEHDSTVSFASDVYALGSILYALLALKAPFSGGHHEIMQHVLAGETPPLPRSVPVSLGAVVRKAMARDSAERYPSVEELRMEIRRYLTGFPSRAEVAGFIRKMKLFYKRNRRICRTVFLGLLLTGALVAIFMVILKNREQHVVAARHAAEESRLLQEQEKERSEEVELHYSGEMLFINKLIINISDYRSPADGIIYNEMLQRLEKAGQLNPSDAQIRVSRAIILFILQRFNEASKELETTENWAWTIRDLAQKYGQKKEDSARLEAVDMRMLLWELNQQSRRPSTKPLIEKMVSYDLKRREPQAERAVITQELLSTFNPQWNNRIFEFDASRRHLVLGGTGLSTLKSKNPSDVPVSLLRWLNLHTLELRDMAFSDLEQLYDLPVIRLDIRQMTGKPYKSVFSRFHVLDELVMAPGQMPERMKQDLPKYITVTEEPIN